MVTNHPNSSHVSQVEYDYQTRELKITFKNGKLYLYQEVAQEDYDKLMVAESIGKAVSEFVKKYRGVRQ